MIVPRLHFEWGRVPLKLLPRGPQVRFYGVLIGRVGIGVIRSSLSVSFARRGDE